MGHSPFSPSHPLTQQPQERLLTIKDAAEALETARYQNLWAVLNSRAAVFDLIPTWRAEIRKSECVRSVCRCWRVWVNGGRKLELTAPSLPRFAWH